MTAGEFALLIIVMVLTGGVISFIGTILTQIVLSRIDEDEEDK